MKKVVALILIFLVALCPLYILSSVAAGDFLIEDGVLLSFTGLTTTVTIPDDVYYIADNAFKNNTKINKLNIPDTVKAIGNEAFYGCTSLKEVNGGNNVSFVGAYAFYGTEFFNSQTSSLITLGSVLLGGDVSGELSLDESISMIAPYAFSENSKITSVSASDSLRIIGEGAFYRCTSLSEVNVGELSFIGPLAFLGTDLVSASDEDFVIIGDGILIEYTGSATSVNVPENVEQIAGGAFYSNTKITEVTIPEGVVSIGQRAFMNCSKLQTVTLPQSLLILDKEAFARCKNLQSVTVPENVELIGESVFFGCTTLERAEINSSTDIPKGLFANCSNLKLVRMPQSIDTIGEGAFLDCTALTDISISDSVSFISENAFSGALNLTVSCNEGSYAFEYCNENSVNAMQCGDANLDGKVNIRDATYIQKHVASILQMTDLEILRAEVNFDGKINVRDATYIQKLLAGLV